MKKEAKNRQANIHRHSSEYHDGADNLTHYLGNDEYREPNKTEKDQSDDGKIAFGNELEITDEDDRD
jgi:hypothetical protein